MSHASVIVAISPEQLTDAKLDLEIAVAHQMEPFEEGGQWFADGSRWDWFTIGGRYTGKFTPGYDAHEDPLNQEACWLCGGTGKRDDHLGQQERLKNPAYGCNGCHDTGRQLKSASKWQKVGNVCKRSELNESDLAAAQRVAAENLWKKWLGEKNRDDFHRDYVYGLKEDETLESLVARYESRPLSAFAFLKDRHWHERDRLGMFGMTTATECERKAEANGMEYAGRCVHTCEGSGAKIVSFDEDENDRWDRLYFARFIRNLPEDTTLVCVDYHV